MGECYVTSFCRVVAHKDLQHVADLVNGSGYYSPVTPEMLVNLDVYVAKIGVEIVACAVSIRQGTHAYLDYLCVAFQHSGMGVSVHLLDFISQDMLAIGVRYVHACVNGTNSAAAKLSTRYHAKVGFPYLNVFIDLEESRGKL